MHCSIGFANCINTSASDTVLQAFSLATEDHGSCCLQALKDVSYLARNSFMDT